MTGSGRIAGLAFALSLGIAAPVMAEPEPVSDWRWVNAETGDIATVAGLRALADAYPDSASVRRRLLVAQLAAGDPDAAETAHTLAERGFAFSDAGAEQIAAGLPDRQGIRFYEANRVNRVGFETSELLDTVPASAHLVEGVARDPTSGTLFVGTVVSRQLLAKAPEGEWEPVELEQAGSLAGMAHDPARGLIWIGSGMFEETPGAPVYAAALGFDPRQGKVVRTLYANGEVPLGDIAVGDDGRVFAANPLAGEIHYADPSTEEGFRALVGAGVFRSPQGMVKVPGRNRLIVSDYRYGLAALDWDSGKVWRIASPGTHWLDGIDALLRYGNSLIAVQNGHQPMRILHLDMREDWLAIDKVTVLESGHTDWTEPVGAWIDGDRLIYVATGQWDVFGEGGMVRDGKEPLPTRIRSLPLGER